MVDCFMVRAERATDMKADHIEKRAPRVPKPPPRSSASALSSPKKNSSLGVPLPPPRLLLSTPPPGRPSGLPCPPPPPGKPGGPPVPPPPPPCRGKPGQPSHATHPWGTGVKVFRLPELVEFYHSLMKREAKRETSSVNSLASDASDARSNMIGEIESKSSFLLAVSIFKGPSLPSESVERVHNAYFMSDNPTHHFPVIAYFHPSRKRVVRADVETQGKFVQSLAAEVRAAAFTSIEDLVSFANWLDEELSFLVDERAVLKHFDWPEGKTDALREAAFEYQDLKILEEKVSSFVDDPELPCEQALNKMHSLYEKMEESIYTLLRNRDLEISRYKEFGIPIDWLLDSGVVGKIKLSSVELARKFMKRVASELDSFSGPKKERKREFLILQGVRFAFRIHQFAGGFDADGMMAFEELKGRIQAN